jgi:hypothetical protein
MSLERLQAELAKIEAAEKVEKQRGPRPTPVLVDPRKRPRRAARDARKLNR